MRFGLIFGVMVAMLFAEAGCGLSFAQPRFEATGSVQTSTSGQTDQAAKSAKEDAASTDKATDARTDKQKTLAWQADRLVDMANELKVQVDKTNKNILSMKVVEKAQEIENFAKGIKAKQKGSNP